MATDDIWVFGYGSLMWRPGFDYLERHPAVLFGSHRRLCVYSTMYRGTKDKPGLVLGLDRGGSCRGVAFKVSADHWPEALAYLREREQRINIYDEVWRQVRLAGADNRRVSALCYVVNRDHEFYTGPLGLDRLSELVAQGTGEMGPNPEYVANTVEHLREMGIHDPHLMSVHEAVLRRLKQQA